MTPADLADTVQRTQALLSWPDGWNGYDAMAPTPHAVAAALRWLDRSGCGVAVRPSVTSDGCGNVVYEWWLPDHKYTVYIEPHEVCVVRVDGTARDSAIDCYEGLPV